MRAVVIINPVAGGRRRGLPIGERVRVAQEAFARHEIDGLVLLTERAGHASELAQVAVAGGADTVVAWGGDGTINEVASQLAGAAALGIVRAGSGNGLARELGIPASPRAALDIALAGRDRRIDVGEIEGRPFLNVAGIGFDAAMAAAFNRMGGERRGPARYALRVLRDAFGYPARRYEIDVDGQRVEAAALVVAIANLRQYGSNVVIAPRAAPDDGLLDVVIVGDRRAISRVGLVPRLFDRTLDKAPGVGMLRGARVSVAGEGPLDFHVDGEPQPGTGPVVRAGVCPGRLRVRVAGPGAGRVGPTASPS
jgi:YegS/Rv2252/BmrU family lipid kinase